MGRLKLPPRKPPRIELKKRRSSHPATIDEAAERERLYQKDLNYRKALRRVAQLGGDSSQSAVLPGGPSNRRYHLPIDRYSPLSLVVHQNEAAIAAHGALGHAVPYVGRHLFLAENICQWAGDAKRRWLIREIEALRRWAKRNGHTVLAVTSVTTAGHASPNGLTPDIFLRVKQRFERICREKLPRRRWGIGMVEVSYNKDASAAQPEAFEVHVHALLVIAEPEEKRAKALVRRAFQLRPSDTEAALAKGVHRHIVIKRVRDIGWASYLSKSMLLYGHTQRSVPVDEYYGRGSAITAPMPRLQQRLVVDCLKMMKPEDRIVLVNMRRRGDHIDRLF